VCVCWMIVGQDGMAATSVARRAYIGDDPGEGEEGGGRGAERLTRRRSRMHVAPVPVPVRSFRLRPDRQDHSLRPGSARFFFANRFSSVSHRQ
jgi:hypothetical protein